jgi:glucosamine 6-phosphate synthetase-like amidotransferase/phosphosugar isomerase protein
MCGIAGYSVSAVSGVDRTLATQALLAGIAERGTDAAGYAWRSPRSAIITEKQRSGASALLERVSVAGDAIEVLVHVRAHTKGHPDIAANNHPIRHRSVVGIHNGTIENDDAILAALGRGRHVPEASVDSEAIFALAEATRNDPCALEAVRGSMAGAWLDEREPGVLRVARGSGRPLWLGQSRQETFFASTRGALALLARTLGLDLETAEAREGVLLTLVNGRIESSRAFHTDRNPSLHFVAPADAHREARRCRRRVAELARACARRAGGLPSTTPDATRVRAVA